MRIEIETASYNERRYSGTWSWGEWVGDARNGGAGTLILDAEEGDIIEQGQKDYRKPRNSAPEFYVVKEDGSLEFIGDTGAAYKYFKSHR